jgi:hypothetical protein
LLYPLLKSRRTQSALARQATTIGSPTLALSPRAKEPRRMIAVNGDFTLARIREEILRRRAWFYDRSIASAPFSR